MSYGLDWKTQEDRLSLGFLSRLSAKGKESTPPLAGDHSVGSVSPRKTSLLSLPLPSSVTLDAHSYPCLVLA